MTAATAAAWGESGATTIIIEAANADEPTITKAVGTGEETWDAGMTAMAIKNSPTPSNNTSISYTAIPADMM